MVPSKTNKLYSFYQLCFVCMFMQYQWILQVTHWCAKSPNQPNQLPVSLPSFKRDIWFIESLGSVFVSVKLPNVKHATCAERSSSSETRAVVASLCARSWCHDSLIHLEEVVTGRHRFCAERVSWHNMTWHNQISPSISQLAPCSFL